MKEHLGEFKLINKPSEFDHLYAFTQINSLVFTFKNYSIKVNEVRDITLAPDGDIIIEIALFDRNLYNAYVKNEKVELLTEYGKGFDIKDCEENIEYEVTYKNYHIKSASGSKISSSDWVYVLEKVDE